MDRPEGGGTGLVSNSAVSFFWAIPSCGVRPCPYRTFRGTAHQVVYAAVAAAATATITNTYAWSMHGLTGSLAALRLVRSAFPSQGPGFYPSCIRDGSDGVRAFSTSLPPCQQAVAAKNHYATLGVDRSADTGAIKGAYYKLAKTYHPDLNKSSDASAKFLAIQNAYTTLSDGAKRRAYDREHMPSSYAAGPRSRSWGPPYSSSSSSARARYYDPFSSFNSFGDHRTTYTYEDLKRAAQQGTGKRGGSMGSYSVWEDMMDEEEDEEPPFYGYWNEDSAGPSSASSYSSYWDEHPDDFYSYNKSQRQRSENEFDEFLFKMAADSFQMRHKARRPHRGQYAPNPQSKRSQQREAERQARQRRGSKGGASSYEMPYTSKSARGPKAAAHKALQREKARLAESAKQRRRREAGSTRGASGATSARGGGHDASVTVTAKAARTGTVLHRVPVSLSPDTAGAGMECALCDGSGARVRVKSTSKCSRCRGKGFVVVRSLRGAKQRVNCQMCEATGFHAQVPVRGRCSGCDGTGVVHGKSSGGGGGHRDGITVRVKVPPGTRDQDVLRVPVGKGGASTARIQVRVSP